ncbi:unnamed protein product [Clonostachys solani]|uniref:PCA1 HMA heavy metal-associated domain-containing protein n=1 Tax=Clonostachys solani TaxID=160281 RepID=A0A9N9YZ21_9HYPO|nr:unnamed protein product [Clonostachys solani]
MFDERLDTGTLDHHQHPARDGFCQPEDCKPETARLDGDYCKHDEDCHAAHPCAEDHSHPHGVVARVDDNASVTSKASTCCGSVERCDEKCICTAAQIECAKPYQGEGDYDQHKKHPHEHNAAGESPDMDRTSHLTAAFENLSGYQSDAVRHYGPHHHHGRGRHHHHQHGVSDGIVRRHIAKTLSSHHDDNMSTHLVGGAAYDYDRAHDRDHGHGYSHSHDHGKGPCCTGHPPKGPMVVEAGFVQNGDFNIEKSVDYDLMSVAVGGMDCKRRQAFPCFSYDTWCYSSFIGGAYFLNVADNSGIAKDRARQPSNRVTDVFVLDKKTIQLAYGPTTAGARTILDSISDKTPALAPPCADPQLETFRRGLWDEAIKTGLAAVCIIPVVVLSRGQGLTDKKTKEDKGCRCYCPRFGRLSDRRS